MFDPVADKPDADLASRIVWFDAYVTNVDRTPRNPNLLLWHRRLWLIDHGAALYFHHTWIDPAARSRTPFPQIADHILLPYAAPIPEVAAEMRARLTPEILAAIVDLIPETWLDDRSPFADPVANRAAYMDYLTRRLAAAEVFVEEAERARTSRASARAV